MCVIDKFYIYAFCLHDSTTMATSFGHMYDNNNNHFKWKQSYCAMTVMCLAETAGILFFLIIFSVHFCSTISSSVSSSHLILYRFLCSQKYIIFFRFGSHVSNSKNNFHREKKMSTINRCQLNWRKIVW